MKEIKEIFLDIGCGGKHHPNATHCIDIQDYSETIKDKIFIRADVTKGIPRTEGIQNEGVAEINMSHFLEHLLRSQALAVLKDCYTVLKPDGVIAIDLPDALRAMELGAKMLQDGDSDIEKFTEECAWGRVSHTIYGNQESEFNCHRYGYSHLTLKRILDEAGFEVFWENEYGWAIMIKAQKKTASPS